MMGEWTFFSNHGHVLVCLARDSGARLRDVAGQVGITERAVQKIVRDLQDEGYLEVSKHGRRNRYRINNRKALRHHLQSGCTVGQLLALLKKREPPSTRPQPQGKPEPQDKPDSQPRPRATEESRLVEKHQPSHPEPPESSESDDRRPAKDLEQGQLF